MRIQIIAALPAIALLVACGGGGGTTTQLTSDAPINPLDPPPPPPVGPTVGPETVQIKLGSRPADYFATYVSSTDSVLIEGYVSFALGRNTSSIPNSAIQNLPDGLVAYAGTGNRNKALRAVTPSGGGTALSVMSGFARPDSFGIIPYREHARLTDTVLPTGTATYTGTYLGTISRNTASHSPGIALNYAPQNDEYIRGNLRLNADFANATIDGTVSGRTSNKGRLFEDVQLGLTRIADNGTFSGGVSGGELTSVKDSAETRDNRTSPVLGYSGVIAGVDGAEAVGNVAFDHHGGPGEFLAREVGVFIATAP